MDNGLFYIEFIGLPGVGKSSLLTKVVDRLQSYDDSFYTSEEALQFVAKIEIDRIYRNILKILPKKYAVSFNNMLLNRSLMQFNAQNDFISKNGDLVATFLQSTEFNTMGVVERSSVFSAFIEFASVFECIDNFMKDDAIVFFEEGFIQKSFMFISPSGLYSPNSPSLLKYLDNIPIPDLVIYIKSDIRECYRRMVTRTDGLTFRLKSMDEEKILSFLETSAQHLHATTEWLKINKKINLIEINNDDFDIAVSTLEAEVKSLF